MVSCPCCESTNTADLLSTPPVPVNSCVLVRNVSESLSVQRRPIDLWCCTDCDFLWNNSFEPDLVEYSKDYEGTQSFSGFFRNYTQNLATDWIGGLSTAPQTILEAGCGQGEFLDVMSSISDAKLVGYDPAYRPRGTNNAQINPTLLPQSAQPVAEIAINRMTLEHVANPKEFIEVQKSWLTTDGHLISQVPNGERMLRDHLVCDLLYEHMSYFTKKSIVALMKNCGLSPIRVQTSFENQHLTVIAGTSGDREYNGFLPGQYDFQDFARSVTDFPDEWQNRLNAEHLAGNDIWVWGAGSRATAFMCNLANPDIVSGVIDINPNRDGTYVLGSSWLTQTPQALKGCKNISIIVMNPIYMDEIAKILASSDISANLIPL